MEIDTSKLQPGMVVKNYKELCGLLGIVPKEGDSKKKQLKEIEQYISYDKSGRTFIIKEIFEKPKYIIESPKPRDKRRKYAYSIYSKYVQLILLQYLNFHTTNGIIIMTKTDIYKMLGLINKSFGVSADESEFLRIFNNISIEELNVIKTQAYAKMNSILNKALKSLEAKRVIMYFTVMIITEDNGKTREATEEEIKELLGIEHDILEELNCRYIWEIYEKRLYRIFYQKFQIEIEKHGWKHAQKMMKIIFTHKYIVDEISKLEYELSKKQINDELILFLKKGIKKKHEEFNKCYKPYPIGINKLYEEMTQKPENSLYILPEKDCMEKFKLISEAFIRYIMDES